MSILISVLYELLLFLGLLFYVPLMLIARVRTGKYQKSLMYRLGLKQPDISSLKGHEVIWIHAVSVGEVIASSSLFEGLRREYPGAKLALSCVTETGFNTAKNLSQYVDVVFFLPIDEYFITKNLFKNITPQLLLLVEGEYWPNLLKLASKRGVKTIVVNGKMSSRSFRRFYAFKIFTQRMLKNIDAICAQKEEDAGYFLKLGFPKSQLSITGNLKFDIPYSLLSKDAKRTLRESFSIKDHFVVTIASTHEGEESLIFHHLKELLITHLSYKIILIPRHPERFESIKNWLKMECISFSCYSELKEKSSLDTPIILIDRMGLVSSCYEISHMAIVGGSFVPTGGHNILEAIRYGIPTVYGPYMYKQKQLDLLATQYEVGFKIYPEHLQKIIERFMQEPKDVNKERATKFMRILSGAAIKTLEVIKNTSI